MNALKLFSALIPLVLCTGAEISHRISTAPKLQATLLADDIKSELLSERAKAVFAECSKRLMPRFWEIDLQTKRRMDMILSLYEVYNT